MIVIGLTGGIGMGKSTVAGMFADAKLPLFNADEAVHRLYEKGGKAVPEIAKHFPACVKDGAVDRALLGAMILSNGDQAAQAQKKRLLENIVHPLVRAEEEIFLRAHAAQGARAVVLEIPLLFETGADKLCHVVICVTASPEAQRARVMGRDGMTEEKFQKIVASQMPDDDKQRRANYVVRTDCSIEDTRAAVYAVLQKLGLS